MNADSRISIQVTVNTLATMRKLTSSQKGELNDRLMTELGASAWGNKFSDVDINAALREINAGLPHGLYAPMSNSENTNLMYNMREVFNV